MGIVEAYLYEGSNHFRMFAAGSLEPTDSLLYYPKAMFEARDGSLWITDSRSVVRFSDEGRTRFELPEYSWSSSFVRSYSMAEDELGHLIVMSQRGQVFVRHGVDGDFRELPVPEPVGDTNVMLHRADGRLWVGGHYGVRCFVVSSDHRISDWRIESNVPDVMDLAELNDGRVLLGTASSGLQVLSSQDGDTQIEQYVGLSSPVVHDIAMASDGSLFISSDFGLAHIRPSFFDHSSAFMSTAIQSVAVDPRGNVFGVESGTMFAMVDGPGGPARTTLFTASQSLTTLATDGSRHWAGSATGIVYLYRGGDVLSFGLSDDGAVSSIALDGNGNAWVAHLKKSSICRISVDGSMRHYGPEQGVRAPVNLVRYLEGSLYVGTDGDSYLLRYDPSTETFEDMSQPLGFATAVPLSVQDIDVASDGRIWLATNVGLLYYGSADVTRFTDATGVLDDQIRAIRHDRFGQLWVGTEKGVFRISSGQVSHFRTEAGIAGQTVHYRSIVVDSDHRPWVGHYGGLTRWNRVPGEKLVTPQPTPVSLLVDNKPAYRARTGLRAPYGAFVEGDFVALSYPGRNLQYQSRLVGLDGDWGRPSGDAHLHIPSLSPGDYVLQVRAQQEGYLWSAPAEVAIRVMVPWYRKGWVMALFVVISAVGFLVLWKVHDHVRTLQLRNRNERLERLVTKRTKELTDQKKTIEQTNRDLKEMIDRNHEFLGIAAHDLRNPLTSLIGFSELLIDSVDDMSPGDFLEKSGEILPIIHRAASTMQGVIQDLLDSQLLEKDDRKLKLEETDLSLLTRSVINLNSVASRRKGITLTFHPKGSFQARVDARSMQRVIDNLVSNAIKYSPPGSEVKVKLSRTGGAIRISVIDQGPGLTEEDKSRVFGKLQRLSAKPTGGEPSTGLGLYVAKGVTELHGGRIGVNSVLGEGSEFWVEIPSSVMRAAA